MVRKMTPDEDSRVVDAMARLGDLVDFVAVQWRENQVPTSTHLALMSATNSVAQMGPGLLGGCVNGATLCDEMPEGPSYSNGTLVAMSNNHSCPRVTCEACVAVLFSGGVEKRLRLNNVFIAASNA